MTKRKVKLLFVVIDVEQFWIHGSGTRVGHFAIIHPIGEHCIQNLKIKSSHLKMILINKQKKYKMLSLSNKYI